MAETISDAHILAMFTLGRWVDLERREGRTLSLEAMARRIDIPAFQLEALIEHGRLASRARPKLLAFNALTESDLANRPEYVPPSPDDAEAYVRAKVQSYVPDRGAA